MFTRADILKSITPGNIAQTIYLPLFVMAMNPLPKSALATPFSRGTPPKLHDNLTGNDDGERLTRHQRKAAARDRAITNFHRIAAEGREVKHLHPSSLRARYAPDELFGGKGAAKPARAKKKAA